VEVGTALERFLSEKRRLHEQAELRVRIEPPPPVEVAALKAELIRRDATLAFLLWEPELHTALIVYADGAIEFVDYDGIQAGVDDEDRPLMAVQVIDRAFAALQTEAKQQVASIDHLWQSRVVAPLRRLLWEPLQQVVGDGPLYLVPDPALAQAPVRTWSRSISLLPTPGALLAQTTSDATTGSIFAVGGDLSGGLAGPAVDLALVGSRGGVTGVGDQLEALFQEDGSFELALVTGHMSSAGIALPRTVISADSGEHTEISVTATLRELMALRLKLRWGVLSGCLSGASDGSPDLLSVGGVFMQVTGAEAVVATLWSVRDLPATLIWAGLLHHTRQGLELEPALEVTLEELRGLRTAPEWADYLDVLRDRHPDVPALVEFVVRELARHPERLAIPQVDLDAWAVFRR